MRKLWILLTPLALLVGACSSQPDEQTAAVEGGEQMVAGRAEVSDSVSSAADGSLEDESPALENASEKSAGGSDPAEATTGVVDDDPADESTGSVGTDTVGSTLLARLTGEEVSYTTGRFEGTVSFVPAPGSDLPADVSIAISGAYDAARQAADITVDFGTLGQAVAVEESTEAAMLAIFFNEPIRLITIDETAWIQWSFFNGFLGADSGGDDTWFESDVDQAESMGGEFGFGETSNPMDILDALAEADATITEVGPETVRGVATTRYTIVLDAQALLDAVSADEPSLRDEMVGDVPDELPLDLWIDAEGMVRRLVVDVTGDDLAGGDMSSARFEFDLFDIGEPVDIEPPPADQIVTEEELGFSLDDF